MKSRCARWSLLLFLTTAPGARSEEVAVLARSLSARSPNVAPAYPQFGDLTLCVGRNGFMEWTAELQGGRYYVHFLYASGERRPCQMTVNRRKHPGDVLGEPTGGFMPAHLRWRTYGPVALVKGQNSFRIATAGYMPHLKGLCISTSKMPPAKSVFPRTEAEVASLRSRLSLDSLRRAIAHLAEACGDDYPQGRAFLARLDALEKRARRGSEDDARLPGLADEVEQLRREALVAHNPLLRFGKLLFVRRFTYQSSHYYTDYIDGCRHFGGNLCVLSLSDGRVAELVPELAGGIFGRFDLSFDAKRVVFGYKPALGKGFRIYEVGADGTGLRQLTFEPPDEAERVRRYRHDRLKSWAGRPVTYTHHTDDMHPCYLPDGGICFVSTRCERGILCDGPDLYTTTTLYRMDADGSHMEVLSDSPVSEASPSVTNDGRILYTRWEYVDKGDVSVKCLWAVRPDGSGSVEVYGNDITFPDTFLHGRAIPGANHLFVVLGAPHMPLGVGTVIRLDLTYPIRTRAPMTYITPDTDVRSESGYFHLRHGQWARDTRGPLYCDPYPLSRSVFLVSCNPDRPCHDPSAYGLYLLDEFGNRVLLHRDAKFSCWQPAPLRPRPVPTVLPSVQDPQRQATVVMTDVYEGLEGVPRGTIEYLRVMETVPRPWAARRRWDGDTYDQQHAVVSRKTHLHVKILHGVVPVHPDGSAHFTVPADKNLFFQALDADFLEVQRMRTFVNFRPGEQRSCIGCHQPRERTPAVRVPEALLRPPATPAPQPGDAAPRPIHYPTDVQPILDRHCVRCHSGPKPKAQLDLSGQMTTLFSRSYESLLTRGLVKVIGENHPKTGNVEPVPPRTLGSHASKLIAQLRKGCPGSTADLPREAFIKLVTWVDANAPYYGSYFGRRHLKHKGHPDFRPVPTLESASGIPPPLARQGGQP